eukprot:6185105-Pleurochrysis_carterae.AAC.7
MCQRCVGKQQNQQIRIICSSLTCKKWTAEREIIRTQTERRTSQVSSSGPTSSTCDRPNSPQAWQTWRENDSPKTRSSSRVQSEVRESPARCPALPPSPRSRQRVAERLLAHPRQKARARPRRHRQQRARFSLLQHAALSAAPRPTSAPSAAPPAPLSSSSYSGRRAGRAGPSSAAACRSASRAPASGRFQWSGSA